jgi:hypothetical protein
MRTKKSKETRHNAHFSAESIQPQRLPSFFGLGAAMRPRAKFRHVTPADAA